jgi:hypothetical protein
LKTLWQGMYEAAQASFMSEQDRQQAMQRLDAWRQRNLRHN